MAFALDLKGGPFSPDLVEKKEERHGYILVLGFDDTGAIHKGRMPSELIKRIA